MSEGEKKWITFDKEGLSLMVKPDAKSPMGFTAIKIFLDDGTDKNEYTLNLLVEEAKTDEDSQ
eukprot:CAMPEP_0170450554 /NCGR_PEP_ID=MMETSP0123-20130129/49_1 /TAXON_ID=182087 /ORGANISM="Favella ehrenbergii, Strain Fehren 1" /LENGTH=62 /DNA_ID=CAMNT_0010711869 /DNA_START=860 /DNA_END=1048 /DNA_ORIENTATION=-